ncbi:hypothetical protein Q9966_010133 [Columba livia]|nr:hypothetical protein Q9966_010133 [Columba livia]
MGVTSKCVGDGERRHGKGQTEGEGGDAAAPGRGPSWAEPGRAASRDLSGERGRRPPAGELRAGRARQPRPSPRRSRPPRLTVKFAANTVVVQVTCIMKL